MDWITIVWVPLLLTVLYAPAKALASRPSDIGRRRTWQQGDTLLWATLAVNVIGIVNLSPTPQGVQLGSGLVLCGSSLLAFATLVRAQAYFDSVAWAQPVRVFCVNVLLLNALAALIFGYCCAIFGRLGSH